MVKVKFCGIRRTEDIEAVNRLKPDLAGFVFAKSKRQVTKEQAAALKELLDPGIKTVAVLVNMPVEEAAIAKLKTLTGAKIIKAIRLRNGGLPVQENGAGEGVYTANAGLLAEAAQADYYLFDTFLPDTYGGTGKTFSLSLLKGMRIDKPFFLAGGLDADNVAEIIGQVQMDVALRPYFYGIDVSGGIETDGYKDTIKMEAFMIAIRGKEKT